MHENAFLDQPAARLGIPLVWRLPNGTPGLTAGRPVSTNASSAFPHTQAATAFSNPLSPQAAPVRWVNAPYVEGNLRPIDAAIFWFGRINATDNYADVRIGYTDSHLIVWLHIIDRRIWHLPQPTAADLTHYDAASLFLSLDGNVGASVNTHEFRFTGMEFSSAANRLLKLPTREMGRRGAPSRPPLSPTAAGAV